MEIRHYEHKNNHMMFISMRLWLYMYLTKAVDEQDEDCGEDSRNWGTSVPESLVEKSVVKTFSIHCVI